MVMLPKHIMHPLVVDEFQSEQTRPCLVYSYLEDTSGLHSVDCHGNATTENRTLIKMSCSSLRILD